MQLEGDRGSSAFCLKFTSIFTNLTSAPGGALQHPKAGEMYYVFYIIKHLALSSFAHRNGARQLAETDEIQGKTSSP